jgi:HK97 family phage portal protein
MSFWSWLGKKIIEEKVSASSRGSSDMYFPSSPGSQIEPVNYSSVSKQAYMTNVLVKICIDAITNIFVEGKLRVYSKTDNQELPDHQLQNILNAPNEFSTRYEFWRDFLSYGLIAGNKYIEKVRSRAGKVAELWTLRPDRVTIKTLDSGFISHYIYKAGQRTRDIPTENMIHSKTFHPLDDYFGMSPVEPGFHEVDTDNISTEFVRVVLENKGVGPGTMVEVPARVGELTEDEITRLRAQWSARFGQESRGKVGFVAEGMKVSSFGFNMQELEMSELTNKLESRICGMFHVPPGTVFAMVGLKYNTFNNAKEARRALYEDGVEPIYRELEDLLNQHLVPDFDENIYLKYDTSDVTALAEQRKTIRTEARENFTSGIMTLNEARTVQGLDPTKNGDAFVRPMNLVLVPADAVDSTANQLVSAYARKFKASGVSAISDVVGRRNAAEAWKGKIESAMIDEFNSEKADVTKLASEVGKLRKKADSIDEIDKVLIKELEGRIDGLYDDWIEGTIKNLTPVLGGVLDEAATLAAAELGTVFDITNATQQKFVDDYGFKFARKITDTSDEVIRRLIKDALDSDISYNDLVKKLKAQFDEWVGKGLTKKIAFRADMVARTETIRAVNQGALQAYKNDGIEEVEWDAAGDACPYCTTLDGKSVPTGDNFIDLNAELVPDPVEKVVDGVVTEVPAGVPPLKANYEAINAPPAHPNCRCVLKPKL